MRDELLTSSYDLPSDHRHKGNGVGCLTDNDFTKYFDSDDQELLEAMTKYEADISIQPEWFNEDPFETEHQTWTRKKLTPAKMDDHSGLTGDDQSTLTSSNELADFDEAYVDASWFDDDFDQT